MDRDQQVDLDWRDGVVPVSKQFDDPYFSLDNGLAETRFVFLEGNDLPARFRPGFHIAELGFGTGLNMLAALIAWRAAGMTSPLQFTSFEAFPMVAGDMARALQAFPEAANIAAPFLAQWAEGKRYIELPDLIADIRIGDARRCLADWDRQADAWFLDGFSPAKNPELWEPALMAKVGHHTAVNGTAATYTAAGFVRQGLSDAGFTVSRIKGFGRKRHMTIARKEPTPCL